MALEATPSPWPLPLIAELADLERETWPARRRALRATGVPLNEGDDDADDDQDHDDDDQDHDADRDDADADDDQDDDDEKAKAQKARREAASLRKRLRTAEQERDQLRTELDGQKDVVTERDNAVNEARRLRAAFKAGLDLDLADRLRGDTDEELDADAESFVERTTPAKRRGTPADAGAGRRGKPPRDYDPAAETDPQKVRENARKARRRSRDGD